MKQEEFFSLQHNKERISKALLYFKDYNNTEKGNANAYTKTIFFVLSEISSSPKYWDENCKFSIENIGDSLLKRLPNSTSTEKSELNIGSIYVLCARLVLELDFNTNISQNFGYGEILSEIRDNLESNHHSQEIKSQLTYAMYHMPSQILKHMLLDEKIHSIKEYNNLIVSQEKNRVRWLSDINDAEIKVSNLKDTLKGYETAFNFVGLYDGFNDLRKKKEKQEKYTLSLLIILAVAILIPPIVELVIIFLNLSKLDSVKDMIILSFFPLLTLEVLLVYYFRVILHNLKSIKSQLVQIDLRLTLCQFIQSYTEYASKLKQNDKTSLEKFENLIFSGIVTSEGELPSTYDGVTQIASAFQKLRGK